MTSLQIDYLVRKEQYQDLIRQAGQDRLYQMAKQQSSQASTHQQVAGWLGQQMVKWGLGLQNYATSNISRVTVQTK